MDPDPGGNGLFFDGSEDLADDEAALYIDAADALAVADTDLDPFPLLPAIGANAVGAAGGAAGDGAGAAGEFRSTCYRTLLLPGEHEGREAGMRFLVS